MLLLIAVDMERDSRFQPPVPHQRCSAGRVMAAGSAAESQ
jgi:hypothetical protein